MIDSPISTSYASLEVESNPLVDLGVLSQYVCAKP